MCNPKKVFDPEKAISEINQQKLAWLIYGTFIFLCVFVIDFGRVTYELIHAHLDTKSYWQKNNQPFAN